jgi:methyl-accepting chemotaxis protein
MRPMRFRRVGLSVVIAGFTIVFFYLFDSVRTYERQLDAALSQARQVVAQAESLILYAHAREEKASVDWAAHILSIGGDTRPVKVSSFVNSVLGKAEEQYQFDIENHIFYYSKIISPENGEGLQVQIQLDYIGFLGARSLIESDILSVLCFALMFLVVFLIAEAKAMTATDDQKLRNDVLTWVVQAKVILTDLGKHIKNMIQNGQMLAQTAFQSRASLDTLFQSNTQVQKIVKEMEEILQKSDLKSPELEESVKSLKALSENSIVEVDTAFHRFDHVFKTTEEMSQSIGRTTSTMTQSINMLQDLKSK